jgi:hypothetical protein
MLLYLLFKLIVIDFNEAKTSGKKYKKIFFLQSFPLSVIDIKYIVRDD